MTAFIACEKRGEELWLSSLNVRHGQPKQIDADSLFTMEPAPRAEPVAQEFKDQRTYIANEKHRKDIDD